MNLSRCGFNPSVQGVEYLDKIYDLVENKISIKQIGWNNFLVYEDDAITEEVQELQRKLSKAWFNYKNYRWKNIRTGMSETCYQNRLKAYEEEQQREIEKQKERERKRELKQKKEEARKHEHRGVYGIYVDNELVYIGKTNVNFDTRFEQHKQALLSGNTQHVYQHIRFLRLAKGDTVEITFKPLIDVLDLKVEGDISNRDIEAMELGLIQLYKPAGNVQGTIQNYQFS